MLLCRLVGRLSDGRSIGRCWKNVSEVRIGGHNLVLYDATAKIRCLWKQGQVGQRCVLFKWIFLRINVFLLWMSVILQMNECFIEWIIQYMYLLLGRYNYSWEKQKILELFINALLSDWPTDQPMDTAYNRDARTHLTRPTTYSRVLLLRP